MTDRVAIGKVLKPRGLKGELKCQVDTSVPDDIFIGGKVYKVLKSQTQSDFTFMMLQGVDTIEKAELLRNTTIEIEKQNIKLKSDEVLISDLLGFEVVGIDGKKLGMLLNIENYGSSDIFDCGTFSFPNEEIFVIETNMKTRQIIINQKLLEEIIIK